MHDCVTCYNLEMNKLFLMVKSKEVVLWILAIGLLLSSAYFGYSNQKLVRQIALLQAPVASSTYSHCLPSTSGGCVTAVPVPIVNNFLYSTTSVAYNAYADNYQKLREDAIGCYFSENNVNERINLNRSMGYTFFQEAETRYVPSYGNYEVRDDKPIITLVPQDSSKILFDIDNTQKVVTLKDAEGVIYKKGKCVDFYNN